MTNDEKAKAYEMALEAARKELGVDRKEWEVVQRVLHNIFPTLHESEDERIRKWLVDYFGSIKETAWIHRDITCGQILAWLEKQKEEEGYEAIPVESTLEYKLGFKAGKEFEKQKEQNHDGKKWIFEDEYQKDLDRLYNEGKDEVLNNPAKYGLQKDQKPASTEDMPYITDEHFYEREQADSFKYRLAEYMTKNCKKEEGPYGYSYSINSESILQMAKGELIKRGIVVEREQCCMGINGDPDPAGVWKPSEEQMEALEYVIRDYIEDGCNATANYLQEILDHLKNM